MELIRTGCPPNSAVATEHSKAYMAHVTCEMCGVECHKVWRNEGLGSTPHHAL